MGPNLHFLEMNNSSVEVDVHRYRYTVSSQITKLPARETYFVQSDTQSSFQVSVCVEVPHREQYFLDKFLGKFIFSCVRQTFFYQFFLDQFYEPACCRHVGILHVYLPYRSENKKTRSRSKIKLLLFRILKIQTAKLWKLYTFHTSVKTCLFDNETAKSCVRYWDKFTAALQTRVTAFTAKMVD